jgi:hypothetical protein
MYWLVNRVLLPNKPLTSSFALLRVMAIIAINRRTDLPLSRPVQRWPYRAFSTANITGPTSSAKNVINATITHAPLANVTIPQLVWFFNQNLEQVQPYIGGGSFSIYLQWHPRDHCHAIFVKTVPPNTTAVGDTWQLQEFFMARNNFTQSKSAGFRLQSQINLQVKVCKQTDCQYRCGSPISFQAMLISSKCACNPAFGLCICIDHHHTGSNAWGSSFAL